MIKRIFIGLFLVIAALVYTIPAEQVLYRVLPGNTGLALNGVEGTVWSGSAETGRWQELELNTIAWSLNLTDLLLLRAGYHIDAKTTDGYATGDVSLSIGGVTRLADVTAIAPWSDLRPVVAKRASAAAALPIDGTVRASIETLSIEENQFSDVFGQLVLANITAPDNEGRATIGDFRADIRSEGEDLIADLIDDEATIGLNGNFRLVNNDAWTFNATLSPQEHAPKSVVGLLSFAQNNKRGENYVFTQTGSLKTGAVGGSNVAPRSNKAKYLR